MPNSKWNSIIVDDIPADSYQLKTLLDSNCPYVKVLAELSSVKDAITCMQNHDINLVFCNPQLGDDKDIDMINRLGGHYCPIVFLSENKAFAMHEERYAPFGHLYKPVCPDKLLELMSQLGIWNKVQFFHSEHLNEHGFNHKFENIILKTSGLQHVLRVVDIVHLEGDGNYSTIYLAFNDPILVSKPLLYFENLLPAKIFFRVHQSHMINLNYIKNVQYGHAHVIKMSNGNAVPLARRRKDPFLKWLIR